MSSPRFFTLETVTRRIQELLAPAFARVFWVKAEIQSGRERPGGGFFCDLVELGRDGRVKAQLRCTIWGDDLARMRRHFAGAGLELELKDGTLVGLECRLQYHPRYGLSLQGLDMDPSVALGELELRRRRILEALDREGLLARNRRLPVPLLPGRIGLVTSGGSAGFRDFVETLHASAFGFRIYLADTVVQGADVERRMLRALDAAERLPVDLVVILRGGGSRTELAALDNDAVARRIAAFRKPVWTGIGHETDTSILDHVAAQSFKTPTAIAEELVGRFDRVRSQLLDAHKRMRATFGHRLREARRRVQHAAVGLRQGTRKHLESRRGALRLAALGVRSEVNDRLAVERGRLGAHRVSARANTTARLREGEQRIEEARGLIGPLARAALDRLRREDGFRRSRFQPRLALRRIEFEQRALVHAQQVLRAADPALAVRRGFSLTYSDDGTLVRSVDQLAPGDRTRTHLADGIAFGTVTGTEREEAEE